MRHRISLLAAFFSFGCAPQANSAPPTPTPVAAAPAHPSKSEERGKGSRGRRGDGPSGDGALVRKSINAQRFPNAVCIDGSTPVFYLDRGSEADKWVVWFKGGGSCVDEASCAAKDRTLTSSAPWMRIDNLGGGNTNSPDGNAGGILSQDPQINPDFSTWNHVYLVYCSGDDWAGTRAASKENGGPHFQGSEIATAMLAALDDPAIAGEPTIGDATRVILSGSSAGAAGLRNNLDRLVQILPQRVSVKGFSDAGITPSVTPKRTTGDEETWKARVAAWQPRVDASCERALAGDARWQCLEGRVFAERGFLETPTFFRMDQQDPVMLGDFDTSDPVQARRAREASAEVRRLMANLPGAYSPSNGFHIALNDARFSQDQTQGLSAAEVFGNWYFDRPGPKALVADADGPPRDGRRPDGRQRRQAAPRP